MKSSITTATLLAAVSLFPMATMAQTANAVADNESAGANEGILASGDIVVTALRRDSTLQETPISIAAMSGETLRDMGSSELSGYFRQVPNLNVTQGQIGSSRISIRGVNAAGEATVGLYYDETPVTGPSGTTQDPGAVAANLNLFDVERVEVLRGPQGTLYGASSMAGTLRIIFNKPDASTYETAAEAEASAIDGGGTGYGAKAMVNMPIVEDKLAVRLVGYYQKKPGFIDNVRYGDRNINDSTARGVRALIGYEPGPDTTITATAIYEKSTADDQQGWYPQVGRYKTDSYVRLPFNSEMQLYNLKADQDFGFATLTATGTYYKFNIVRTVDFTPAVAALGSLPSTCSAYYGLSAACSADQQSAFSDYASSVLPAIGYQPAWLKSQNYEVRLASNGTNFIDWTIGGYYEHRKDHIDSNVTSVSAVDGAIPDPLRNLSYRYVETTVRQMAGFGEVTLHPTDKLSLTGGLRYYDYTKSTGGEATLASPLTASMLADYSKVKASAHGLIEKFNVSYNFTPDLMAYATAAKGFRPGGANNIPILPENLIAYDADSLWNYEAGIKTSWLGGDVVFNAAVFQIDWSNMQLSARTADGLYSFLTNAGAARIRGGEVDLTVRPLAGLSLSVSGGYTDGKLTEDQANDDILVTASSGRKGDRLPNSPKWSSAASASYKWALNDRFDGLLRADFAYTGKMKSNVSSTDPYLTYYGDYATLNLRAGVENETWGMAVYVNNVTDTVGNVSQTNGFGYSNLTFSIQPRTFGVNFHFAM
ncbi:TonB-dependent receptor [Novosphingobium sp. KN65.2]|uniref:TonB-dependent receptor n=1 Tax=Novosphingobium sp. KN65.2 TaxID=1478134 RepID=UPI0005EA5E8D|nr:TonB-dependent receptor [Novosphingobium sp. KN65.2]CDO34497.1 TonB-dependent receptor plug [Novosphingobium sp. KN65.2]